MGYIKEERKLKLLYEKIRNLNISHNNKKKYYRDLRIAYTQLKNRLIKMDRENKIGNILLIILMMTMIMLSIITL